jgi:hypothetical protein
VWLLIGLLIYFAYSRHHSRIGHLPGGESGGGASVSHGTRT